MKDSGHKNARIEGCKNVRTRECNNMRIRGYEDIYIYKATLGRPTFKLVQYKAGRLRRRKQLQIVPFNSLLARESVSSNIVYALYLACHRILSPLSGPIICSIY